MHRGLAGGTIVALAMFASLAGARAKPAPVKVCATTTSLASLAAAIGGEEVAVETPIDATEDPRRVVASPRLVACVRRARLLIVNGVGLEERWLPGLLDQVSSSLRPGGHGYLDASAAVPHPLPSPYYLLDPVNGLAVAGAIRTTLEALQPASRRGFTERYEAFRARLGAAMVGERLSSKYPVDKLADLYESRRLGAFLEGQHERPLLGGWFAARPELATTKAVGDRDVWAYFARCFHVVLEDAPRRPARGLVVLTVPFSALKHTQGASKAGAGRLVPMAPQVGARPGTDDYLALITYDLRMVAP